MPRIGRPGVHEALLDAARDEFGRRGVDRARVDDIARRAGISKGAFYLHFRTKEEAFREILQRFLGTLHDHALRREEVEDRLAREAAGSDGSAHARRLDAECAIDADLLELLWRNRRVLAAAEHAGVGEARLGDFRRRLRALVSRRIVQRQAAGELRPDVGAALAADVLVDAHEGLARRMVDLRAKPDLGAWTRSILVLLYEGLLVRPGTQQPPRPAAEPALTPRPRRVPARRS